MNLDDLRYLDHRTSSGHASFGVVGCTAYHPDGAPRAATFIVSRPVHQECDFWLCTCRQLADNEDRFFGPASA